MNAYPLQLVVAMFCVIGLLAGCANETPDSQPEQTSSISPKRPNVLVILADDLGYTDVGVYGGEIATPNLDKLAAGGTMLTDFHTAPTCSPTRSMLLSGADHHRAGIGSMAEYLQLFTPHLLGKPGYEGYLNDRVATLPELLRDNGYSTYMTGKWHLGKQEDQSPAARGFDRSFVLLDGGAGHFDDLGLLAGKSKATYREDYKIASLPEDFYSTRFFADRMIEYIREGQSANKPFFAYLAFTAPHWPLQAPQASIEKYKGMYDAGYEALFRQRIHRQQELGLLGDDVALPALLPQDKPWDQLSAEEKARAARTMEVYAAMIDDLDVYVGKVINALKEMGEYENTFIVFLSDNGAEGSDISLLPGNREGVAICCDNSLDNMGNGNSYIWQGSAWARASVGPGLLYKRFATEGSTRVPAIFSFPGKVAANVQFRGFASVLDLMPTILQLAGVQHPGTEYKGHTIFPMQGTSMLPVLSGQAPSVHAPDSVMGWEFVGNKGLRQGNWKITLTTPPFGDRQWRLFNLESDPAEQHDLSAQYPELFAELQSRWQQYADENGVQPVSMPH